MMEGVGHKRDGNGWTVEGMAADQQTSRAMGDQQAALREHQAAGHRLDGLGGCVYTDEEVVESYKEFFEDVHGEFLRHGEIVNFKVCRNESSHLRGNVYAQFQSVESAVAAYHAINGRFYAAKQITCEFVVVTRWRAALCGEYMRSHHRVCSHGTACNFLHCFKNPHGLYDWADWDSPPRSHPAGKGHSRGNSNKDMFYRDRDSYRRLRRSPKETLSNKNKRSYQSHSKRASRYLDYYDNSYREYDNRNSSEENRPEEKVRSQKKSRHKSSRRYQDHHDSPPEESLLEAKVQSQKKKRHGSSDRTRGGDHQTERKVSRKQRRRSRSRDRSEAGHTQPNTGVARASTPRWRGRSRSHESSESVVSSDRGSVSKSRSRRRSGRDRHRSVDRYRPRSRSLSIEQHHLTNRRQRSSSSSEECR
ncbi:hypothetical protein L7F22_049100 [Adiantum nelumboides]|nr:hypothetical protein [Adiantum nelumboides]